MRRNNAISAARRDPLTGLANRLLVREHLEEALLAQLEIRYDDGSSERIVTDLRIYALRLPQINLDDRRFQDLVRVACARGIFD